MILHNNCSFIPSFFTNEEVALIHREADNIPLESGRVGFAEGDPDELKEDFNVKNEIRQSEVKWFGKDGHEMPESIVNKIHEGVGIMVQESGWSSWEYDYLEPLQYTIYNYRPDAPTGDFYTWHTDAGPDQYETGGLRKLSFSIQLSHPDEYEGGHFEYIDSKIAFDKIMPNQKVIELEDIVQPLPFSAKEKGSIIVFPSFVHHQVKPVTSGTRISLVGWLVGKPYV